MRRRAKLWVPAGGSLHSSGGEMSSPSRAYLLGIIPPEPKAGLASESRSGVGVGVGVGVGGTGVAVGSGVRVGTGVDVGGTGVAVGSGVDVGGTGVAVGVGLGPQPLTARAREITVRNNRKIFLILAPPVSVWMFTATYGTKERYPFDLIVLRHCHDPFLRRRPGIKCGKRILTLILYHRSPLRSNQVSGCSKWFGFFGSMV